MSLSEAVRQQISGIINKHRIVLFMKGTPQAPQCGFSAQVVGILGKLGAEYEAVDVLRSSELREGIKEYSQWPTIPQLYIGGKFMGGCDIVTDLHASGELQGLLGTSSQVGPKIVITEAAREALAEALKDDPGMVLKLQISADFEPDLFLAEPVSGEIQAEVGGLVLRLDPGSARRADGVRIDFIAGPEGGFKIDNPNQPPSVKELSAAEVKTRLARGELTLFDVRPEPERQIASIAGAHALDGAGQEYLMSLDPDAPVAFYCHHGIRSRAAAEQVLRRGFRQVYNLKGGIDAWSTTVDSGVPRY